MSGPVLARRAITGLIFAAALTGSLATWSVSTKRVRGSVAKPAMAWANPTRVWEHHVPPAEQELMWVAWSPDSRHLAILTDTNRHIQILDRASGRTVDEIRARYSMGHPILYVNEGRNIISARWQEDRKNPFTDVLTVLATDPLRVERQVQSPEPMVGSAALIASARNGGVVATFAYGQQGQGVAVFNSRNWQAVAFLPSRPNRLLPLSLALTPDGKQVVVGGYDDLRVCNVAPASCGPSLKISTAQVRFLSFSGDGKKLATCLGDPGSDPNATQAQIAQERDHMLRILDYPSLAETTRVRGIVRQQVDALEFHPTLPLIAVASGDNVQLIDADTGDTVTAIEVGWGANRITSVAFSPNGECLAIGFDTYAAVYCTPLA